MEYAKLFNTAFKGIEKNRVKFGEYENQKAIIIDGCYLILVPEKDFLMDMEKCLKVCGQVRPVDCTRMFAAEREAEEYKLTDTKFLVKINRILYHQFERGQEKLYFREEAFSYLSKWEDLLLCKVPGRAQPAFIYAAGNVTRLVGLVMPFYHNEGNNQSEV